MLFYWGRNFFDRGNVRRIEEWKVITKSSLELIAELKLAQDGVFKIHVAFKCTVHVHRYKSLDSFFFYNQHFLC